MEKKSTKKTQIYVNEEQYRYLAREARSTGSITAVVRRLIDEKIREPERGDDPLFRLGTKSFAGDVSDLSVEHDRYLYEDEG